MPAQQPVASPTGSATSAAPSPVIPGSSSTAPPGGTEFTIPDCSDPRAITSYALQRLDVVIAAYQAFLDQIRGRDDVSFALVAGGVAAAGAVLAALFLPAQPSTSTAYQAEPAGQAHDSQTRTRPSTTATGPRPEIGRPE